ncbi:hypothetical protein MsAm2_08810 [Methanolapillus ohkumae]|uniref:Uncharacterized protein n=1 Tax=Methanolapillus ohkumae TaxID=3028298 RepID=A0AA96ZVU7_9EURY|nr:hypothetical protein MsAm2_08810 [Methanosarcinaceae archaeon Am2]
MVKLKWLNSMNDLNHVEQKLNTKFFKTCFFVNNILYLKLVV